MTWWHRLFQRRKNEEALEKELSFHLDEHTSDLIAQGYTPEEARRQARLTLGGPEQVKEMCRDVRRTRWLADMLQDLRYGTRILAKHPGFTVVAVLALALGIGVNTAILSAVNGFVLRPLPVENPEELVATYWGKKIDKEVWGEFSYPNYLDLREQNKSFSALCAWTETSAGISSSESRNAGDSERAEVVWGELVSGNYFDVMGVKPVLGRGFLPEEDRTPNAHPVVVIGHQLWQRRFNADAAIVGKTIYLNGLPFTVVGVMPESFLGSAFFLRKGFWAPLMMAQKFGRRAEWNTDRSYPLLNVFGRLKPGLTMAQAETDLNLVADNLAKLYPLENADTKIQLTTEVDGRYTGATKVIKYGGLLALCVSGLVLLLACANVANLMLARAATRAREIGIRLAIGASRGRIVRQLLTESVLLGLLGGVLGWALAYWGADMIRASFPPVPYPVSFDFSPDGYVLKWMLVVSLLTGVIFGLAPALLASRTDLVAVIKGGAASPSHSRRRWNLRGVLVIAQVTISLVVLICAGLFIRSLRQARQTDPGFETANLVTMMINPRLLAYDEHETTKRFFPELLRRLEAQPGVRSAAMVNEMPLMVENLSRGPIVKEGEPDPQPNQGVNSDCNFVTPKYFDTMKTPLVLGRDFTDRDTADAPPVVVVNQEFARRFYGSSENAMGRRFRFAQGAPLMEIIGIAKDGRYRTLYEDRLPFMFLPVYQHPRTGMTLLISAQSAGDLHAVVDSARREIAQMDARLPVVGVMMAEENMTIAYWGPNLAAGTATTFGVLALVLATMGLYSVMTYDVSQRTHEIGIRMALGANLRDVLRLIVSQGMRMVLIGIALGLVGAFALTRVLASLLLDVGTTDFVTFVGVTVLLVAVALLACYIPARRAARVDPLVALRHE
ncbi:MAG TPA: ABC transporter permease [Pyrinomonadaceae bacterium]|jgi:predicted permease|nr:ABC transporter permease [Pyrinomonadaceae bacterium]